MNLSQGFELRHVIIDEGNPRWRCIVNPCVPLKYFGGGFIFL